MSGLFVASRGDAAKTGPGGVEPCCMCGAHRSQSLRVGGVEARPYLDDIGGATRRAANIGSAGDGEMLRCLEVKGYF